MWLSFYTLTSRSVLLPGSAVVLTVCPKDPFISKWKRAERRPHCHSLGLDQPIPGFWDLSWAYRQLRGLCEALLCLVKWFFANFSFSDSWQRLWSPKINFGSEYFGFETKSHCGTLIKNVKCVWLCQLKWRKWEIVELQTVANCRKDSLQGLPKVLWKA